MTGFPDQAWGIIDLPELRKIRVPWNCGLPLVGFLTVSEVASGGTKLALATNHPDWGNFWDMCTWSERAREGMMPEGYCTHVTDLTDRLSRRCFESKNGNKPAPNEDIIQAWNKGVPAGAFSEAPAGAPKGGDAAVMLVWNHVCSTPDRGKATEPYSYSIAQVRDALPFQIFPLRAEPRCCRCRVVYRYRMNRYEPNEYPAQKPYFYRLSCAEVWGYQKTLKLIEKAASEAQAQAPDKPATGSKPSADKPDAGGKPPSNFAQKAGNALRK